MEGGPANALDNIVQFDVGVVPVADAVPGALSATRRRSNSRDASGAAAVDA